MIFLSQESSLTEAERAILKSEEVGNQHRALAGANISKQLKEESIDDESMRKPI
jgi:hypothetical protein